MQKTNISSLLVITISVLNIIFSSFYVLSLKMNVAGVVLGTVTASYLTLFFHIFYIRFYIKKISNNSKFEKLFIQSKLLKLFNINLDIFIRTLFLTFSFYGLLTLALKSVKIILQQMLYYCNYNTLSFFLDAYAFSTEGIVGFTIGRKNKKTFMSAVRNSIEISLQLHY